MKFFGPTKTQSSSDMGKRSNVSNQFSTLDSPNDWLLDAMLGVKSETGVRVTPLKAMGVATVFACVNLIAKTISTLPLKPYRKTGNRKQPAEDHPTYDLLNVSPNPEMTFSEYMIATQGHLSLRNSSYSHIRRNRKGEIHEIWPIHPSECKPFRDNSNNLKYRINESRIVSPSEIIHLRGLTSNGISSSDLVITLREVIGLAIALEENAMKFFANSSRPSVVLESPSSLSEKAYLRLKNDMQENHEGLDNVYKAMILEEGLKASKMRADNKDSQFDESRARQDRQIASVYGVPPNKIGIQNAEPRANVEEQAIAFVVDVIRPIAVMQEQHLNFKLLTPEERKAGYFFKYNLNALLRGNVKDRGEFYSRMLERGVFSIDDVRDLEEMNPLDDDQGKVHYIPANSQIIVGGENLKTPIANQPDPEENKDASTVSDEQEDT